MSYWNKTITLYNRYEDDHSGIVKWYRHILSDCFVKQTNNKVSVGGVQLTTNDNIIRIPEQSSFLFPAQWRDLSDVEKKRCLTLQAGDLIFLGAVEEDIDELTTGQRANDLIVKYSVLGSVYVKAVNINDQLPNSHYYVRGE